MRSVHDVGDLLLRRSQPAAVVAEFGDHLTAGATHGDVVHAVPAEAHALAGVRHELVALADRPDEHDLSGAGDSRTVSVGGQGERGVREQEGCCRTPRRLSDAGSAACQLSCGWMG